MMAHHLLLSLFLVISFPTSSSLGFTLPQSHLARTAGSNNIQLSATPSSTNNNHEHDNNDEVANHSPSSKNIINRRSAIEQATTISSGIALSSLLLSSNVNHANAAPAYDDAKKRILITGSNSGIGLDAAQRLAVRGHEVVLACVSVK